MIFTNSYSRDLFRQQQARKDHSEKTHGAEKSDTAKEGYRRNVEQLKELNRLHRLGMCPSREVLKEYFDLREDTDI